MTITLAAGRTWDEHAMTSRSASRRRQARAHKRAREQAVEAGSLMDVVNHELRTPLTSVVGFTEMLLSGDAGDLTLEQRLMLDRVDAGAQQLQCLVEALLAAAQAELRGAGEADVVEVLRRVLGDRDPGACCA